MKYMCKMAVEILERQLPVKLAVFLTVFLTVFLDDSADVREFHTTSCICISYCILHIRLLLRVACPFHISYFIFHIHFDVTCFIHISCNMKCVFHTHYM